MDHLLAHAVKILSARPQSRSELQNKLSRLCFRRKQSKLLRYREPFENIDCKVTVDETLTELHTLGLIDDSEYAKWHVEQRSKFRPRSRIQLRGELAAKGVASDTAAPYVNSVDELSAAFAVAKRKPRATSEELLGFLARKGFSPKIAMIVANTSPEERQERALRSGLTAMDDHDDSSDVEGGDGKQLS